MFEDVGEVAEVFEFFEVFVDGVEFLDLFSFDGEGGVDFECEGFDFVHGGLEDLEFVIDFADVVFHLSYGVDAADELGVVFEDEGLDLMIVDFDFLIDFVVFADELLDGVLLDHAEDVLFGVEVGGVDVHGFKFDLICNMICQSL